MKPPPFDYLRPATTGEAVAALADAGGEGKVLAGGQSLVPVLAMRLGRPGLLVDINAVAGLDELSLADGLLRVGATVRQRRLEHDPLRASVPLLRMALPWIGHRELRTRGTICGSLAHADPAAELPAVAACLGATLDIAGPAGRRTISARDFCTGPMTTVLAPDELLLSVSFPVAARGLGEGYGFAEFARRHGDFALAGIAVKVRRSGAGSLAEAVIAAFGVASRPVVRDVTSSLRAAIADAGDEALPRALTPAMSALAGEIVTTPGDMHASTAYRRRLFTVLAARELAAAYARSASAPAPLPGNRPARSAARIRPAPLTPAGQQAETTLTVNGKRVTLLAPPRLTLADALRDRLRLTGTHLGCEHGACGMCTVLVNGEAARSCLLFACQLDGADVLTVEGLGRPGDLHPLQQAFSRHHALQCGFCTPGFLLSAYDLLTHRPPPSAGDLPAELSGVLCRCTGYRNILAAVTDVAQAYPAGLPGPLNRHA